MGLAASVPLRPEDNFSITYYAPAAACRAARRRSETDRFSGGLRPMGPRRADHLTKEFFMPRFLERDERCAPSA